MRAGASIDVDIFGLQKAIPVPDIGVIGGLVVTRSGEY